MRLRTIRTESVDIFKSGERCGWRKAVRPSGFSFAGPAWLLPADLHLVSASGQSTLTIDITNGLEVRAPKVWK